MKDEGIEVTKLNWGSGHLSGPTETSWVKLIEQPNARLMIVQQDMGPETQACFGSYEFEHSIRIAGTDRTQLTAVLLSLAFDDTAACSWEDLKRHCLDWSIPFQESERSIS